MATDITGGLFCLAIQHHWEQLDFEAPKRGRPGVWVTTYRCGNCGSDRLDYEDVHGVLTRRSYQYSQEFRFAQKYADKANEVYSTKEQYRAAYLQYRRQKVARRRIEATTRIRRVK